MMNIKANVYRWLLFFCLSVVVGALPYILPEKRLQIFPHPDAYVNVFDDRMLNRNLSRATILSSSPLHWVCEYHTLGEGMVCGLEIRWGELPGTLMDFSGYDNLILDVDYDGIDEFITLFMVTVETFPGRNDDKPFRKNMEKTIHRDLLSTPVEFPLDDFSVSPWWMKENKVSPSPDILKRDKVRLIQFANERPLTTRKHIFTLRNMTLVGSYLKPAPVFYFLIALWFAVITFFVLRSFANKRAMQLQTQQARLEEARARAEAANLEKTRFLATASHDLRQPLHNMGFLIESLVYSKDKPLARQTIEAFDHSKSYLTRLLDSLLDLSRIELNVVETNLTHISIRQLYKDLQSNYGNTAREKDLQLHFLGWPGDQGDHELSASDVAANKDEAQKLIAFEKNHSLLTDYNGLYRIVANFLSNAIKYTEQGWVKIYFSEDGECVWLHVNDSGPGFNASEKQHLFDAFYQIDNQSRTQERGLGLGLHIAQRLSEILSIELKVDSEPGVGSTFSVKAPMAQGPAVTIERPFSEHVDPSALKGQHVLLIENEQDIQNSMGRILKRWGVNLSVVATQQSLNDLMANGRSDFDLVISDFMLSETETGAQLVASYFACDHAKAAPAILMTGSSMVLNTQVGSHLWRRVLNKPVSPEQLLKTMLECLDSPEEPNSPSNS